MQWLIQNKEWVFSGIGVPIVIGIITFLFKRKNSKGGSNGVQQNQSSGKNSTNIQGGHNVTVTLGEKDAPK